MKTRRCTGATKIRRGVQPSFLDMDLEHTLEQTLENIRYATRIICLPVAVLPRAIDPSLVKVRQDVARMRRAKQYKLLSADWRMSNAQLAEVTGYSLHTIISYRRQHAPETLTRYRAAAKIDWDAVDMTLPVPEICEITGCSERVARQKKRERRLF